MVLASEFLHPQNEDAQAVIPIPAEVPVAAVEPNPAEAAESEVIADRVAGIRADPVVGERNALTSHLVVREDETGVEGDVAETRQVVLREFEPRADLAEMGELFIAGLAVRARHEARNPEHQTILSRLVGEVPALQVRELLVARAGFRRVGLHGEACADAIADGHGGRYSPLRGETPVLDQRLLMLDRYFDVHDDREVLNDQQRTDYLLESRLKQASLRDEALGVVLREVEAVESIFQKPIDLLALWGRDLCSHRPPPGGL